MEIELHRVESSKDVEGYEPPPSSTSSSPSHTVQIYSNEDPARSPRPLQNREKDDGLGMRNRAVSKYIAPGSRSSALEGKSNQTNWLLKRSK